MGKRAFEKVVREKQAKDHVWEWAEFFLDVLGLDKGQENVKLS